MTTLIKIHADDCEICESMSEHDKDVAAEKGLEFKPIELADLATRPETDVLRGYVIHYHVDKEDGSIDVPVYVIRDDKKQIQASGVIQDKASLIALIESWELWLKSQSAT